VHPQEKILRQRLTKQSERRVRIQFVGINLSYFSQKLAEKTEHIGDVLWKAVVAANDPVEQGHVQAVG